jgi:hypothetical protein
VGLIDELKATGYAGEISQLKVHDAEVRLKPAPEPLARFETDPGHRRPVRVQNCSGRRTERTPYCASGGLVYASGFLPRWLGVLLAIAGAGYLAQSFGIILRPELRPVLDTAVVVMAVPGELALTLWLLVRGVDEQAWRQRAGAR